MPALKKKGKKAGLKFPNTYNELEWEKIFERHHLVGGGDNNLKCSALLNNFLGFHGQAK